MGYKEDSKIDIYNLHTELAGQSQIYIEYAEQYADAVAEMMRCQEKVSVVKTEGKKKIDEVKAQLDIDARQFPGKYGLDTDKKPTEAAISNAIIIHKEFRAVQEQVAAEIHEAVEAHIEAVRKKELLEGVKVAFSHRKSALEKECELFLSGYYADPKVPKVYKEENEMVVRKAIEQSLSEGSRPLRKRRVV